MTSENRQLPAAAAGARARPQSGAAAELRLRRAAGAPWYVPPALEGRSELGRTGAALALLLGSAALAVTGCGGGAKRQDENEARGNFKVEVLEAKFPERQKLAKRSEMVIKVRNLDSKTIPNIAVTVKSFDRKEKDVETGENAPVSVQPQLADPKRPIFIVNQSPIEFNQNLGEGEPSLVDREVDPPRGTEANVAYVDTYALGPLKAGETKVFKWSVTAAVAGPFKLRYRVEAGLDGKAKAVLDDGRAPTGEFEGVIEDRVFEAGVDSGDGRTITREGEDIGPKPFDRSNGPNDN